MINVDKKGHFVALYQSLSHLSFKALEALNYSIQYQRDTLCTAMS